MRYILQDQIGHKLHPNAFKVLYRDTGHNLNLMKEFWSNKTRFLAMGESILVTAPTFLAIFYVLFSALTGSVTKRWQIILALLAPMSPLLLHSMGWDLNRWNSLVITMSFLMLYVIFSLKCCDSPIQISSNIYPIFIFLIFLNGASRIDLFDGYEVQQFPFPQHVDYFIKILAEPKTLFQWPFQ